MIISVFNESNKFKPIIEEFLNTIYYEEEGYKIKHDVLIIYGGNFDYYEIRNYEDNKILFTKDYVRIIYSNDKSLDRIVLIENSEIKGFELSDFV